MKNLSVLIICLLLVVLGFSQTVPIDSLYLGQDVPGSSPKVFKLDVSPGYFAAERIAISKDGSEIYYTELNGYEANSLSRIKLYKYSNNRWTGPIVLFEGYGAPSLSISEDTIYIEKEFKTFFSVRENKGWSKPRQMLLMVNPSHYLQATNNGNYFVSATSENFVGLNDWCKLVITGKDTVVKSLGLPLSCSYGNLDFYVAPDESFFLTSYPKIGVCYPDKNGRITNPRYFNSKINFAVSGGAYLSADKKYLFYTSFVNQDNSDTFVYWVCIDNMIDSLKHTNLPPYVKNRLNPQSANVGEMFSFRIPENTFADEDSNNNLTYEATLVDGNPSPAWLNFDSKTATFSGIPTDEGNVAIKVTATDDKKDSTQTKLVISVKKK